MLGCVHHLEYQAPCLEMRNKDDIEMAQFELTQKRNKKRERLACCENGSC